MIIWLASYPKSGNTWLRSLLCSYFFSKNGVFNFKLLDNIKQFSSKNFNLEDGSESNYQLRVSKNWIPTQEILNKDKKVHFLKTHNALCSINGSNFTNRKNTLASIYIVRDPRNVVTSISNHFNLNITQSIKFISNKKKIIFPQKKFYDEKNKNDPKDFNFLGSWSEHYLSWKNIKISPILVIKYEDLVKDTEKTFISVLKFLSLFMKFDFDESKIKKSIYTTSFENMAKMEKKDGFIESPDSSKNLKKIRFFHLGSNNTWKNLLSEKVTKNIEHHFKKEMEILGYL
jgi:hypothetical protein